ncbi:hypothetical protein V2G26_000899 [Clonostachys chloroleuca]
MNAPRRATAQRCSLLLSCRLAHALHPELLTCLVCAYVQLCAQARIHKLCGSLTPLRRGSSTVFFHLHLALPHKLSFQLARL